MTRIVAIVGGVAKPITRIRRIVGGVASDIASVKAIVGGVAKTVYTNGLPPITFTAIADPGSVSGNTTSTTSRNIITDASTAIPQGGVGPYTYSWTQVSAEGTWVISNATASSTTFRAQLVASSSSRQAVFKCTVTDSTGATAFTNEVNAYVENYGTA